MNIKFRASLKPQHKLWIVIRFMSSAIYEIHWLWMGYFCFCFFHQVLECVCRVEQLTDAKFKNNYVQCVCMYEEFALNVRCPPKSIDFDDFTEPQRSIGLTTEGTRTKQQTTMNRFYFVNTIDSSPVRTPNSCQCDQNFHFKNSTK